MTDPDTSPRHARELAYAEGYAAGVEAMRAALEADAKCYDASADEASPDVRVPAYEVGRAMAVACRTAARAIVQLASRGSEPKEDKT
jgi:hypothetical protein